MDLKTGYRTQQMLVAPILDGRNRELVGVIQIINSRSGRLFLPMMEEGAAQSENAGDRVPAAAEADDDAAPEQVRGARVANAVLSSDELELAQRSARRKNLDLETVLIEEFQVKPPDSARRLSVYFGVPYEPLQGGSRPTGRAPEKHEPRVLRNQPVDAARR